MLRSTATVPTTRAARYRDQLASHGASMVRRGHDGGHAGGPPVHGAAVADGSVVLDLAWGRCTITATDDALVLVAEAGTYEDLGRIQAGVGQRVATIGRRDGLAVAWTPAEGAASGAAPRRAGVPTVVLVVGVVVAVHLVVGAAVLRQSWAWWGVAAIAVLAVLKLAVAHRGLATLHGHRTR